MLYFTQNKLFKSLFSAYQNWKRTSSFSSCPLALLSARAALTKHALYKITLN